MSSQTHIINSPAPHPPVWGDSVQPLLYDYNEYGERVGMRTFQTTPDGDPSHVEDTGAKTAWHFHEATGSLLRKEYADGKGPEYAYNEAGQLAERRWAREGSPQRPQRGTEAEGNPAVAGTGTAGVPPASQAGAAASRIITAYTYDPATLQLAKSTATDGTEVQYEYDADGRLAKVTDATGTREFAYDQRGQVVKESVVLQRDLKAAPIHYEIRRTYTKLGQPESVHLVSADGQSVALDHRIDYAWNDHSQLASVKSLAGEFVYGYNEANPALLTKMTGPAHIAETSYEPHRNLITGVVNKAKPGGARSPLPASPDAAPAGDSEPSALSSYTYANDLLGRRETISQGGEAFGMLALGHNQVEVAYNDRSEVTGAVYRTGGEARQTFDYTYDGIGNRRTARSAGGQSAVGGGQTAETRYETNALNQYVAIDERGSSNPKSEIENPQFDPDGNLLEDARNTYTWNADNNLVRVDAKDGSLRLDYVYDHQSRRTVRIETKQPGTKDEAQRTTYYLYDAWNVVAEHSAVMGHGAGVTGEEADSVRYYTWGRDLSGSLQGAGGVGGLLAISKVNPNPNADEPGGAQLKTSNLKFETLFPTYDANGNIGQLINANANVVAAYAYDPFGNVTEMAGDEAAGNPWRFSTKPVEAGTGWLYYGYRWYDAEMGRWVNRDPIEESGGVNLYGFVGNDAIRNFDMLGLYTGYPQVDDCSCEEASKREPFEAIICCGKKPYYLYGHPYGKGNGAEGKIVGKCCGDQEEGTFLSGYQAIRSCCDGTRVVMRVPWWYNSKYDSLQECVSAKSNLPLGLVGLLMSIGSSVTPAGLTRKIILASGNAVTGSQAGDYAQAYFSCKRLECPSGTR